MERRAFSRRLLIRDVRKASMRAEQIAMLKEKRNNDQRPKTPSQEQV